MNTDFPTDPRQALEASLTALLLGELPPDQAQFLRDALVRDAELARIYQRLKLAIALVCEVERPAPVARTETKPQVAPEPALRLSEDKRQDLLECFKTIPLPTGNGRSRTGWSVVTELATQPLGSRWLAVAAALVLCLIAAAMLLPAMSKAKSKASASFARAQSTELAAPSALLEKRILDSHSINGSESRVRSVNIGGDAAQQLDGLPAVSLVQNAGNRGGAAAAAPKPNIVLPSAGVAEGGQTWENKQSEAVVSIGNSDIGFTASKDSTQEKISELNQLATAAAPPEAAAGAYRFGYSGGGGSGGMGGGLPTPLRAQPAAPADSVQPQDPGLYVPPPTLYAGVPMAQAVPAAPPAGERLAGPLADSTAAMAAFRRRYGLARDEAEKKAGGDKQAAALADVKRADSTSQWGVSATLRGFYDDTLTKSDAKAIDPSSGLPVETATPSLKVESLARAPVLVESKLKEAVTTPEVAGKSEDFDRNQIQSEIALGGVVVTNGVQVAQTDADHKLGWPTRNLSESTPALDNFREQEGRKAVLGDLPTLGKLFRSEAQPESAGHPIPPAKGIVGGRASIALPKAGDAVEERYAADRKQQDLALYFKSPQSVRQRIEDQGSVSGMMNAPSAEPRVAARARRAAVPTPAPARPAEKPVQNAIDAEKAKVTAAPSQQTSEGEVLRAKVATPPAIPQPEISTVENAFSTFSLNVSDVSFKLAGASLEKGALPDPGSIRSEEFINAFDYRDPEPPPGVPVAFAWDRARYPFAQNRDVLRFSLKTAAQGRQSGRPLNLVLLVDNSGSMERSDRVQILREALRVLTAQLQAQDKVSLITFSRVPHLWKDGVAGNSLQNLPEEVAGLTPEGGTNLEEAMKLAYKTAARHYMVGGVNRVVVLTDGAANLGDVSPDGLKKSVEEHRRQGIALDCFGIGWEGYNDDLLEVLSRNGDGRYGFINTPEEAATGFANQLAGALRVAASDVKVQVEFNPSRVTAYRQIGYAKHQLTKQQFRDNTVDAAELGAAEAGNALYVVEVNPQGEGPLATVRIRYKVPGTADYHEHEWAVPYNGTAPALEESSPAMRLAVTASAFSEWLATSPFAAGITPGALQNILRGVPQVYGADTRPQRLESMIRTANSLAGK